MARKVGESLREQLRGTEAVVAIAGMEAMLAYYAEFPTVIDRYGLTDRNIAHRPITGRYDIGHEKVSPITDPYLLECRVSFVFDSLTEYHPIPGDRIGQLRNIDFFVQEQGGERKSGWVKATMLTYQARVMEKLRGRQGVRFTPFPDYLDAYIAELPKKDRDQVRLDYSAFQRFYFDHNDDTGRQRAFERYLSRGR
jgi:hypothetical protein